MDKPVDITSLQNSRIKELVHLRERHYRNKTNRFIIEGYREILRAAEANYPIEQIFVCPDYFLGTNEESLIQRVMRSGAQAYSCSADVFKKVSYRDRPDGLIALAPQVHRTLDDLQRILEKKSKPFLLVAEAIEKPGNLGTILRSADAVNLDALIVCDACTDIFNPNVVRASVGTLFTVPVIEADTQKTIAWLRSNNISILAATPSAEKEYTQTDLSAALAIVVGTEQLGLSKAWMSQADLQVRIPMLGRADSLNVATAATLLLYEALRQRR